MNRTLTVITLLLFSTITNVFASKTEKLPQPFSINQNLAHSSNENFFSSATTMSLNDKSIIGTIVHPTLDGGILNISQNKFDVIKVNFDKQNIAPSNIFSSSAKPSWANSPELNTLLYRIAREGKLDYILRQAEHRQVPASVALLPIVESNFENNALSPKGAAGPWQLMPSLAKDYGLSLSQRFDFSASTQVALQHLNKLYQQFNNWELVYAAYHAGADRVTKAISKNPNFKLLEDLDLPLETQRYVKQLKTLHLSLTEKN